METLQQKEISTNSDLKIGDLLTILKETNTSSFFNTWGPTYISQIYDPQINLQGILVIDNTILGPGCGSIRIYSNISPRRIYDIARKTSLTCALANIKMGGAAVGVKVNSPKDYKDQTIRSLAKILSPFIPKHFIAAPSSDIAQEEIAAFVEELGDRKGATGKPENMGGIPHELGVVGFGIGVAIEASLEESAISGVLPFDLSEATIAIQGFDNVGYTIARYLDKKGAKVVAISDEWSTIENGKGIDLETCKQYSSARTEKQSLRRCKDNKRLEKEDIIEVDCDLLVLTSNDNPITESNIDLLRAKCVIEGANGAITPIADQILNQRNIPVLPDILTTSGGPISSYAEYCGKKCNIAFSIIETRIKEITKNIVERSYATEIPIRRAAKEIAKERILQAMEASS